MRQQWWFDRSRITRLSVICAGLCLCAFSSPVAAAPRTVDVHVPGTTNPGVAEGLLFSSAGLTVTPASDTTLADDGTYIVSVEFDDEAAARDSLVSAIVQNVDGSVSFGIVKEAFSNSPQSGLRLPYCDEETPSLGLLHSQMANLKKLVTVRGDLRDARRTQVSELLTPDRLAKLTKLEQAFATSPALLQEPLSADMDPLHLVARLSNLRNAITSFRLAREAAQK